MSTPCPNCGKELKLVLAGGGGGGDPVDCVLSEWSAWANDGAPTPCVNGTQQQPQKRTRTIVTQPANGGAACGPTSETRTTSVACTPTEEPPPPPPPGVVRFLQLPAWTVGPAPNRTIYTATAGHFYPYDYIAVAITTPADLGVEAMGSISFYESPGDPIMQRMVVLSEYPGDFTRPVGGNKKAIIKGANNASMYFFAGSTTSGYPALTVPNKTYYMNFKNNQPDQPSRTGHFDLNIEFQNPKSA